MGLKVRIILITMLANDFNSDFIIYYNFIYFIYNIKINYSGFWGFGVFKFCGIDTCTVFKYYY